jgi:NhaP-type Na+/H+ and K+/H+ antiporter
MSQWLAAVSHAELKEALFRMEAVFVVTLEKNRIHSGLIGRMVSEVFLSEGTTILAITRKGEMVRPAGGLRLQVGDRVTMTGRPEAIALLPLADVDGTE